MRRLIISATCTALLAFSVMATQSTTASADDTGFASSHTLRKENRRLCMADHFHSGSGTGRTKKAALAAAVLSYREFTAFEYGTDWAVWSRAASKGVRYSKEASGWSATVEARPCR